MSVSAAGCKGKRGSPSLLWAFGLRVCMSIHTSCRTTGTGYRLQAETIGRKQVLYLEQYAPKVGVGRTGG